MIKLVVGAKVPWNEKQFFVNFNDTLFTLYFLDRFCVLFVKIRC